MIAVVLILFILISFLFYLYYHHLKSMKYIKLIPGPPYIPILGNLLQFLISGEEMWKKLRMLNKDYYPLFKIWSLHGLVVHIQHPDDIEKILNSSKHIRKSVFYNLLHNWLGTGLLTSTGTKWQTRRKILTPTFHFNILLQFINILIEEAEDMTQILKNKKELIIEDLFSFISVHTLNAICETAMGISLQGMDTLGQQYREAVCETGRMFFYRVPRLWLFKDIIFSLTPQGRLQKKYLAIMHAFTNKIIADRKRYHYLTDNRYLQDFINNTLPETENREVFSVKKKRLAMLDLLIAASQNNQITDSDIREEVDTFMFEGHDTTAVGVSYALLLLAEHKDIQERVRKEINTAVQESGGKITMTVLQNLPYLERCLKEVLRLYPSVPIIGREVLQDIKLSSYHVPSYRTNVFINIFEVHRNPNFWTNPDVFDPDRFLPERSKNRHPYCYIPFSAGPRNCIGQRFAMLELKAMVAALVYNFYVEPIDHLKNICLSINIILHPNNSFRIKFVPIK